MYTSVYSGVYWESYSFELYDLPLDVSLCVDRSKGKAGIQLKYIPEKRDTFEVYPGKVMNIIGGQTFDPTTPCLYGISNLYL